MTAPDLRPNCAGTGAPTGETQADAQIEHLKLAVPAIEGESEEACAGRIEATLRSHGIDPSSLIPMGCAPGQASEIGEIITLSASFGGEPLTKVLPAGGPLLPGHPADKTPVWLCEGCGLLSTAVRRPTCLQSRTFGCPMVRS